MNIYLLKVDYWISSCLSQAAVSIEAKSSEEAQKIALGYPEITKIYEVNLDA